MISTKYIEETAERGFISLIHQPLHLTEKWRTYVRVTEKAKCNGMFCLQMLKTIASIYISEDINICANFKSKIWKVNLKSKISIFAISSIASRQQYICSSEEEILFLTKWENFVPSLKMINATVSKENLLPH